MTEEKNPVPPSPDHSLSRLTEMARELRRLQNEMESLSAQVEAKQQQINALAERDIPELMEQIGMEKFATTDGFSIELKESLRASIPAARKEEAFQWLEANHHQGLVKSEVSVAFGREDMPRAAELVGRLTADGMPAQFERWIEPATLSAWAREQLEAGGDVPSDLFGIFRQRQARIVLPKDKKARTAPKGGDKHFP